MKKGLVRLLMVTGLCASLAVSPMVAFASKVEPNAIIVDSAQGQIQPRVNWSGPAYLAAKKWCNVTSSNNFFNDKPKVTNSASNPCSIKVRIVNGEGKLVGTEKKVGVGKSITMDEIPWNSGTYTLQAYSEEAGYFTISID